MKISALTIFWAIQNCLISVQTSLFVWLSLELFISDIFIIQHECNFHVCQLTSTEQMESNTLFILNSTFQSLPKIVNKADWAGISLAEIFSHSVYFFLKNCFWSIRIIASQELESQLMHCFLKSFLKRR